MPVLIDEFEVVMNPASESPAAEAQASGGAGEQQPPRPHDVLAILGHYSERELRVRAH